MDTVIAAAITAAASVIGEILISRAAAKRDGEERAKRRQKLDDDIAALTRRVNEHNNYAALFAEQTRALADLSTDIRLMQQDVQYIKEGRFHGTADE